MRRGEQLPWIVPDGLWERVEPLLPEVERPYRYPGRRRLPDRNVLSGILFVLYTGIPWEGTRRVGRRVLYTARGGHVRRLVTEVLYAADHHLTGEADHD